MKKIKFLIPVLALCLYSCDEYLDINATPNDQSIDNATPDKLLTAAQHQSYEVQATDMNTLGNVFTNAWAGNVASFASAFNNEYRLNLSTSFYSGIWDGLYRKMANFQVILNMDNADGNLNYYHAISKITRAHYMQYIVDLYGDAPFSQAWKRNENLSPVYDNDEDIYKSLIADLEDARNLIANAPTNVLKPSYDDVMLKGEMADWVKFANTLELRLLMRMSNVSGALATYRDDKLAAIAAGPFITRDVTVNPGYSAKSDNSMNPAVLEYVYDAVGNPNQNATFLTMSGHAYKCLQSTATTNYNNTGDSKEIIEGSGVFYPNVTDPRSLRLFAPGTGSIRRAVTQGATIANITTPAANPQVGKPCVIGLLAHFNLYNTHGVNGVNDYATENGYVMTYAEACFLQAEAAVRWPSLFSNEQAFFDAGINQSMAMRVVLNGGPLYVTNINNKPWFGLTASTTFDQKIHAIMYQKWIALMGIHGVESYVDYTRTGYPLTPLALTATQTRKPYRLMYPQSEYSANANNVPVMTESDCFVKNSLTPFWAQ
ncbi:MAG: SusD/RagB family nutrient-binding outer membrane lipoprotein [Bacteroidota bacterium]